MTEKQFTITTNKVIDEMNEIKQEKSERIESYDDLFDDEEVTVDDIIGLVKTDEPTNSVEEVRKLRGRETGYVLDWNNQRFNLTDKKDISKLAQLLNMLHEENINLRDSRREVISANNEYRETLYKLEKENEQLLIRCGDGEQIIRDLKEENEQLQTELRNLRKLTNELYMEGSE